MKKGAVLLWRARLRACVILGLTETRAGEDMMEVRERLYDIDDLWRLVCDSKDDRRYELIEGEIIEMPPPGGEHGRISGEIYFLFRVFDLEGRLGVPTVDAGYHPPDARHILLAPDAAFTSFERAPIPFPRTWVPIMPDLAVEVKSPSNTLAELRRKAAIYLQHGARLVWIILPVSRSAEVWRLGAAGDIESAIIQADGSLSGEDVLPGFALPLAQLFDI